MTTTGSTVTPTSGLASIGHRLEGAAAPGLPWRPELLLREQPAVGGGRSCPVLYVHGATFPSALSVMFRFEGVSWADRLNAAGHDVYGLDFAGFGGSERYPAMTSCSPVGPPLGRAPEAAEQIERAVRFIITTTGAPRVSIVAHSWGTTAAGLFATLHPELLDRLVLFGPIMRREGPRTDKGEAWSLVTIAAQHARFTEDVPEGHAAVLLEQEFQRWASAYLDSDPASPERTPASVKVPAGPIQDAMDAWSGMLPYEPSRIQAPTMVVRGEWDRASTSADADLLMTELSASPEKRLVTIPEATHLAHLERGRLRLYEAVNAFLGLGLAAPAPPPSGSPADDSTKRQAERSLFAVVFDVRPDPAHQLDYLHLAEALRPELSVVRGFVENERYRSRSRPGVLLSLSLWDDEKSLIRWRTAHKHQQAQAAGRAGVLADYRLRVGEVTRVAGAYEDRRVGWVRHDETEIGAARALTIVDGVLPPGSPARRFVDSDTAGLPGFLDTEVFDHLTTPDRTAVRTAWQSSADAERFADAAARLCPQGIRVFAIRVVREYGLADRREAPQAPPRLADPLPSSQTAP